MKKDEIIVLLYDTILTSRVAKGFIGMQAVKSLLKSKVFSSEDLSILFSLRWRHNDHAGVSNHQPHGCLLNRLFRRKSKKTSKLRATGLCAGNSPGTGEFPAQMASYAENVSIWWRHHVMDKDRRIFTPVCYRYQICSILWSFYTASCFMLSWLIGL